MDRDNSEIAAEGVENSWVAFRKRTFPRDLAGADINGIDPISLDSAAAGCISTFVDSRGRLDREKINVLRVCSADLDIVVNNTSGETRDDFEHLRTLVGEVLSVSR